MRLTTNELNIIIDDLKKDEGFRSEEYKDHLGFATIGYGTKLPLNEQESKLATKTSKGYTLTKENAETILKGRLEPMINRFSQIETWVDNAPFEVKRVLANMTYQLGVNGLRKFRKSLELIQLGLYKQASAELLNSLWAKQTPKRAKRQADIIRGLG